MHIKDSDPHYNIKNNRFRKICYDAAGQLGLRYQELYWKKGWHEPVSLARQLGAAKVGTGTYSIHMGILTILYSYPINPFLRYYLRLKFVFHTKSFKICLLLGFYFLDLTNPVVKNIYFLCVLGRHWFCAAGEPPDGWYGSLPESPTQSQVYH